MTDVILSQDTRNASPMLPHALNYAEKWGWTVFPARIQDKQKLSWESRHSEGSGKGVRWGATKNLDDLRRYFANPSRTLIGVPTGADNGIFVLDVDTMAGHDKDGFASLAKLEAEHDVLPPTLMAESPSGSRHYIFKHPGGHVITRANVFWGDSGIDVRGDGGMFLAAPSRKDDGGTYRWLNAPHAIADAPEWVLKAVRAFERSDTKTTGPVPDAVDGISHDGIHYDQLCWWVKQKLKRWESEPPSNDEWLSIGKRMKLSFPGGDGLKAFLAMSWEDQRDTITRRWWDPNDFKTEGENLETLPGLFKRDIDWMFRHHFGCPMPPPGPHFAIPAEILDRMKAERERYLAAAMGPLPDHPELTAQQAETLCQFWAHLPSGKIIHETSRGLWAAGSFDKHVGRIKNPMSTGPGTLASTWLSQHQAVQSMGWDPAEPMIIEDRILADDWVRAPGCRTFNIFLPASIVPVRGDVSAWVEHIRAIYPAEADHIVAWFAHRVQRPGEKVNHGLVFVGDPGIGKDTVIEPVVAAIGPHNFKSVSAARFFNSEFNGYLKSVMLRIDEVHDLGGESKYAFHDRTKPVLAAPPATHEINEKHIPHHSARNVCGVILTSNHTEALYLDRNDRRHFVCISDRRKEDFRDGYFDGLYAWFANGGNEAVAHYLANVDLGAFNAKAPPPKTAGWHAIVAAGMAPESGDLADVIEALQRPAVVTLPMIRQRTPPESALRLVFDDPKRRTNIPKRLKECGYIEVANPDSPSNGRWSTVTGKMKIYGRQDLTESERLNAARQFAGAIPPPPC